MGDRMRAAMHNTAPRIIEQIPGASHTTRILAGPMAERLYLEREHGVSTERGKRLTEPGSQGDFARLPDSAVIRDSRGPRIDPVLADAAQRLVERHYDRIRTAAEELELW